MLKAKIHNEDISLNIYVPNNTAITCIKQQPTGNTRRNRDTLITGFLTYLSQSKTKRTKN